MDGIGMGNQTTIACFLFRKKPWNSPFEGNDVPGKKGGQSANLVTQVANLILWGNPTGFEDRLLAWEFEANYTRGAGKPRDGWLGDRDSMMV